MQVQYEGDNWRPDLSTTQTKVSLSSDPAEGHQSNRPSGFDLTDSKSIRIDQTNERFLLFFFALEESSLIWLWHRSVVTGQCSGE